VHLGDRSCGGSPRRSVLERRRPEHAARPVGGETAQADTELDRLSAREQEVMRLIARGYAYKEVAASLFISVKTVETHVSKVLHKLQLSSRHELTAWALARRLL
jgi:DNA-binding NarL/FixJ family response regulator